MRRNQVPLLDADHLLAEPDKVRRVGQQRDLARRFFFGREASRHVGRVLASTEKLVVANRQFAIPPYERTYVEFYMDEFLTAFGRPKLAEGTSKDDRIGFLIRGREVLVLSGGYEEGSCRWGVVVSLIEYRLDTPSAHAFGPKVRKANDHALRIALVMGSTTNEVDLEEAIQAASEVRVVVDQTHAPEKIAEIANSCFGDIRNLWTLLLVLNRPGTGVRTEHRPRTTALVAGRRRVFMAHSTVSIDVGEKNEPSMVYSLPYTRSSPRRHEVKGHFVHRGLREGCEHRWPSLAEVTDDGMMRWTCEVCGGRRTWRKAFHRGNASVGFRHKDYEVEA